MLMGSVRCNWVKGVSGITRRRASFKLTCLITVELHGTIVYLRHGLNLNMISVHVLLPLASYVARNVLGEKLCKVLAVLRLLGDSH